MLPLSVVLIASGAASMVMAHVEFAKLQDELAGKRPDLNKWIYGNWWYAAKYMRLLSIYRAEFPEGRRMARYRIWTFAFLLFWFSGFGLLYSVLR